MSRDPVYLLDILRAARLIEQFSNGVDLNTLKQNLEKQYAIIRCIEIIGEVARRVSEKFKAEHSELPWRDIIGMRNFVIHHYDKVDIDRVWAVIQKDIPALIAYLAPLVPPDTNE